MNRSLVTLGAAGILSLTSLLTGGSAAHAQNAGGPGFLSTYKGVQGGDLVVDSATVTYTGASFIFVSTLDAAVNTTVGAYYVWGVNTGTGAAGFASLGATQDESKVLFNDVTVAHVQADTVAAAPSLTVSGFGAQPLSDITVSGNTLTLTIPASELPSTGFTPASYTANLWPRWEGTNNGSAVTGNAQISQFAPNNSNLTVTNAASAPEPVSVALIASLVPGFAGGMALRRRAQSPK